ncbi:ABC transporter substrate-binding protein [Magnetovibrio sp. PR-2]|uniref:substrate-binding periplasmic protein n=1 Tax=Magnetovibrio sp. PR-2 TaxID=3120356 RepID=UPI002FCE29E2
MNNIAKVRLRRVRIMVLSVVFWAAGAAFAPGYSQDKVYILNTSTAEPYTTAERTGFQDRIVAEVFKRLGLKGRVEHYKASARALINANEGIDDGVAMRIRDIGKRFPNLVRVDEVLIDNDFVAYSRGLDPKFDVKTWADLKGLTVGYINGWVVFENNVPDNIEEHKVSTPHQLFEMLDKRRVDVALYERWQGLQTAHDTRLKVTAHEPPLAAVPMYMHVHKKHADLAVKMANALKEMKQDGTYERIVQESLMPLVPTKGTSK